MTPIITTLGRVPAFARGFVRDVRVRWALEEAGQDYAVRLIAHPEVKGADHRRVQPFGQVPTYRDDEVAIFESGAIVLHVCQRGWVLTPAEPAAHARAVQWLVAALNSVEPWVMAMAQNDLFEADCPWSKDRHPRVLDNLHTRLADLAAALGDKDTLDGGGFTFGDLMMVSVLGGLRGTDILDSHPNLAAYVSRGEDRPAHVKAMADHMAVHERTPIPA